MNGDDLTVLTLTGDREGPLRLCGRYMARQTLKPRHWLVVDDGVVPVNPESVPGATIIRREPTGLAEGHTLPANILRVLPFITTRYLIFFEDDDWYHPQYLQVMMDIADTPVWGLRPSIYYRVRQREYTVLPTPDHASMCCTGVRSDAYPALAAACVGNGYAVDLALWHMARAQWNGAPRLIEEPAQACVGIKGMDGRQGMTWGWRGDSRHFTPDRDLTYLRQLIGEDAEAYAEYYEAQQARKIPLL